jgi:hypothetical protein
MQCSKKCGVFIWNLAYFCIGRGTLDVWFSFSFREAGRGGRDPNPNYLIEQSGSYDSS